MIGDGVEPTPIQIWSWAMRKQRIDSKNIPAQLIYLNLLPRCVAKIRAGGIEVNGMLYVCNRAIEHKWLERARNKGVSNITAWYDPNCTWHVWIKDASGEFARCTLVPSDNRYRGYRVEEVIDMMAVLRKPSPEQTEFKLQEQVKLDEFNETVVKGATSEKRKRQKPKTKAERTSNISSNRKSEMMVERERTSVPDGLRDSANQMVPTIDESSSVVGIGVRRVIDLLKREHK
ncbi:hypothetical protein FQZ97_485790 [compost metagenome]